MYAMSMQALIVDVIHTRRHLFLHVVSKAVSGGQTQLA